MLGYLKCFAVTPVAVACFMIAGCGSDSDGSEKVSGAGQSAGSTAADTVGVTEIDACALISAQDITRLLGIPVEGTSTGTGCLWENPENYESISLEIGSPDTASGGALPPPEAGFPEVGTPGPDGMRFLGGGSVEFPAGGRSNIVQVAVLSMLGEQADEAAIDLARKVGPRIPE
jgi:hypothetical protein